MKKNLLSLIILLLLIEPKYCEAQSIQKENTIDITDGAFEGRQSGSIILNSPCIYEKNTIIKSQNAENFA